MTQITMKVDMKTPQKAAKIIVPPARLAGRRQLVDRNGSPVPARSKRSLIDWPTEREIHEVSSRLAALRQIGARSEAEGDYFYSGDLAYQMHEIIRATADLFRRSQRNQRQPM